MVYEGSEMTKIKEYKSPSSIIFEIKPVDENTVLLKEAKRGDTFICEEAICMATDQNPAYMMRQHYGLIDRDIKLALHNSMDLMWITNLQTGRAYFRPKDTPIKWVRITLTVDGE